MKFDNGKTELLLLINKLENKDDIKDMLVLIAKIDAVYISPRLESQSRQGFTRLDKKLQR